VPGRLYNNDYAGHFPAPMERFMLALEYFSLGHRYQAEVFSIEA
jgi:hypothetical protein